MSIEVENEPNEQRYLYRIDGEPVGFTDYRVRGDAIHLTHTQIAEHLRGTGLGAGMVRAVLDQIRAAGDNRVVADCGFVREFFRRNPEYAALQTRA